MTGFGRILADLNRAGVRYVVIDGIALIRHGVVRATRDIDGVLAPGPENLAAVARLIEEWRATRPDGSPLVPADLSAGRSIHLSTPHGDLDFLAEPRPPLSYAELLARAQSRKIDGVVAPICSLADLVALKRLAGRERDLADLADLEAAHGPLPDARDL